MHFTEITDRATWDEFVSGHPFGHPLQLWGWGEAKRGNRWTPHRLALMDGERWVAGVQVMLWPIPRLGRVIAYVPRGPVGEPGSVEAAALLEELTKWAKEHKALYVRVEPAWTTGMLGQGWRKARHHLQLAETYTLDLRKTAEVLLGAMSHKHRQYIRKSERDGVAVKRHTGNDVDEMYTIYEQTARRAGFGIHPKEYYTVLHQGLGERSFLYYAYFEGRPVAFLWLAGAGRTVYELYGGVVEKGAEVKANYFLKWHVISECEQMKYEIYDFNGRLNEGVSRFKDGFGPDATDYIGTWDYPLSMAGYHAWEHLWPVVKVVGRRLRGGSR